MNELNRECVGMGVVCCWGRRQMPGEVPLSAHRLFNEEPRLLEAFTAGDPAALSEVYVRCRGAARRLVAQGFALRGRSLRYVSGVSEPWQAEEILQEAFTRAFSAAGRRGYNPSKPYLPYLLQIVRHTRIDSLRSSWRYVLASGNSAVEGSGPDSRTPGVGEPIPSARYDPVGSTLEDELDRSRERDALLSYLAHLDEQSRKFVTLRFFEELSQNDTALAMGIGRRRVRTMERRVLGDFERRCRRREWQHTPLLSSSAQDQSALKLPRLPSHAGAVPCAVNRSAYSL